MTPFHPLNLSIVWLTITWWNGDMCLHFIIHNLIWLKKLLQLLWTKTLSVQAFEYVVLNYFFSFFLWINAIIWTHKSSFAHRLVLFVFSLLYFIIKFLLLRRILLSTILFSAHHFHGFNMVVLSAFSCESSVIFAGWRAVCIA